MGSVITDFIPLMIGAAVVPVNIIIVLLLLRGQGGLVKASAFAGGMVVVRLAQGIVFGSIFTASANAGANTGPSSLVSTLLLLLGILLWVTAIKQFTRDDDPDAPPPKWMAMFQSISAPKAFGMGALLVAIAAKQWVFTLGALGIIRDARLGNPQDIVAYLFFVLGAVSLMLIPIIACAVAPAQSARALEAGGKWLEKHNRAIVIAVSAVFGTLFLFKGIAGLLG